MANMNELNFSSVKRGVEVLLRNKELVVNIVGHAGIGKTQLVQSIAQDKGYEFGEITCSLLQEGDLALPYPSENDRGVKEVKYMINSTINRLVDYCNDNTDHLAILFLDEFNRASVQVQSELMNLILQRNVMGMHLPDNLRIITASNPSSDMEGYEDTMYATKEGDAAINDRTIRIRMGADLNDWLENYAMVVINDDGHTRVHPVVTSFLEEDGNNLFIVNDESKDKNPTPRGYTRLSEVFKEFESNGVEDIIEVTNSVYGDFVLESIRGILGDDVGLQFFKYMTERLDYIKPKDFVKARGDKLSTSMRKRIEEMPDVRKKSIFYALINYLGLENNLGLLDGGKGKDLAKRVVEFYFMLDNDLQTIVVNKMLSRKEYTDQNNEFIDYSVLYDRMNEFEEFEDKAFSVTMASKRLRKGA